MLDSFRPRIYRNVDEYRALGGQVLETGEEFKSGMNVPLMVGTEITGMIHIASLDRENAYGTSDLRLLQTLANSMSVALENARLFDETQRLLKETEQRAAELAAINTVSKALVAEPELDSMIRLIGDQTRDIFKADIVYVALLDRSSHVINFPYQVGEEFTPLPLGEGLTSKIIESGQPLLINHDIAGRRAQLGATLVGKQARSYLGVPIMAGKEAIGVLSVQSMTQENAFTASDVRLLSTIAAHAGASIRNASLFREAVAANEAKSAFLANDEPRNPHADERRHRHDAACCWIRRSTRNSANSPKPSAASGDALLTIINDILDFSKIEAGKHGDRRRSPSICANAVEAALDLIAAARRRKGPGTRLPHRMPTCRRVIVGDVNRLRQILVNLLSNAVKFTEQRRGRI